MNLSMQISRAMFAVGLMVAAGACAFAQTDGGTDADAQAHGPWPSPGEAPRPGGAVCRRSCLGAPQSATRRSARE